MTVKTQAIVLAGQGHLLYPLSSKVTPKPLLPIANAPMISHVLNWIEASGITDCIILVHDNNNSGVLEKIQNYVTKVYYDAPGSGATQNTVTSNVPSPMTPSTRSMPAPSTSQLAPSQLSTSMKVSTVPVPYAYGTADAIRHVKDRIKGDFVIIPCDIVTDYPLSSFMNYALVEDADFCVLLSEQPSFDSAQNTGQGGGNMSSTFTPGSAQSAQSSSAQQNGNEDGDDLQQRLIRSPSTRAEGDDTVLYIGMDRWNKQIKYFMSEDDLEDESHLTLRRSLISSWSNNAALQSDGILNLYSSLQDMHVYFCKGWIMDLLMLKKEEIVSLREDLPPYLVRCCAQKAFMKSEQVDQLVLQSRGLCLSASTSQIASKAPILWDSLENPLILCNNSSSLTCITNGSSGDHNNLNNNDSSMEQSVISGRDGADIGMYSGVDEFSGISGLTIDCRSKDASSYSRGGSRMHTADVGAVDNEEGQNSVSDVLDLQQFQKESAEMGLQEAAKMLQKYSTIRVLGCTLVMTRFGQSLSNIPTQLYTPSATASQQKGSTDQSFIEASFIDSASSWSQPTYCVRANDLQSFIELNRHLARIKHAEKRAPSAGGNTANVQQLGSSGGGGGGNQGGVAIISPDSMVEPSSFQNIQAKAIVKKSIVGSHVSIGTKSKINSSIIFNYVTIEQDVKLEGCIVGEGVRIGKGCNLINCELGANVSLPDNTQARNEMFAELSLEDVA
ncbi:hypothetical protein MP228_011381 [Amoeboaphelidium protococcarum]|nr:hypothetical protein MP228_011381 [Amoeboaphelidium protococcarum]